MVRADFNTLTAANVGFTIQWQGSNTAEQNGASHDRKGKSHQEIARTELWSLSETCYGFIASMVAEII